MNNLTLDLSKVRNDIIAFNSIAKEKEWSGVILYSIKSNKIVAHKILLYDIGENASTEFEYSAEDPHVSYVMKYEEALDWKMGLIHSHNTMDAYFSHIDIEELENNAKNYDSYLSVVVNCFCKARALIAKSVSIEYDIYGSKKEKDICITEDVNVVGLMKLSSETEENIKEIVAKKKKIVPMRRSIYKFEEQDDFLDEDEFIEINKYDE